MTNKVSRSHVRWVIWALAAIFYFYEYLLRISPSVMIPELMKTYHVDAAAIGFMVAFYLYAYAPMQLVVGVLMDQYGAKKLLTFASVICGLGSIFFGLSNSIILASIGRLLIGAGSAFAFVGMVFICSHLFPKNKRALVIGLANSIGMLGAVAGGGPLSVAIHYFNWRTVIEFLGFFGVILAFGIFLLYFHDDEQDVKESSHLKSLWNLIKAVCKNPYSWLNSVVASFFYLSTSTFGGLWGTSFLQTSYGWSKQNASFAMSMIFVGWLIGGPLTGFISDFLKKRKTIISTAILLTLICLVIVIYVPDLPPAVVYALLLLVGVFSSAELLHFSYAIEINTQKTKGTAVAFTNGIISFLESGVQPIIGWFLVLGWKGAVSNGIPIYSSHDYKVALGILPVALTLAFILSFFLKEKTYKEEVTPHSSYVENA